LSLAFEILQSYEENNYEEIAQIMDDKEKIDFPI
jgi:hypothetical protein